jgi:hypothetical protein
VTDGVPDALFASRSHTPRAVAWFAASHLEKARGSAKARVGSSPPGTTAAAAGLVLFVVRMVSVYQAAGVHAPSSREATGRQD